MSSITNVTSVESVRPGIPFNIPRMENIDIPLEGNVVRFRDDDVPIENGELFGVVDLSLIKKAYFGMPCACFGMLSSEVAMRVGEAVVGKLLKAVTNSFPEHIKRKIGFASGALLIGHLIDFKEGTSHAINYSVLGMKMGVALSALAQGSRESVDLQPLDNSYDFALEIGVAAGGLVTAVLHSTDASFIVSLAAGALTANQVTKLYCRLINARLV